MISRSTRPWPSERRAKLLDLLHEELSQKDIPSTRDFQVPGHEKRLPLFLPRLPRAAVVFTFEPSPTEARVEKQLQKGSAGRIWLRESLGTYTRLIILMVCPSKPPEYPYLELPKGISLVLLKDTPEEGVIARAAAQKIAEILQEEREGPLGLRSVAVQGGAAAAALLVGRAVGATIPGVVGGLALAHFASSLYNTWAAKDETTEVEKPAEKPSAVKERKENQAAQTPMGAAPSDASVQEVVDQTRDILEVFADLAPESYAALDHELRFLVEEYRRGHHTACALRGGRSLEFVVYELSRLWNIQIHDGAYGQLQLLQERLDRAGDLLGDYQVSEGEVNLRMRREVREAFRELSRMATDLAIDFDEEAPSRAEAPLTAPRTVPTLIKKILKRYGHLEGVPQDLVPLIAKGSDGGVIRRVLQVRNQAAHADVTGGKQEADEATVRKLMGDIMLVMLKLSNVHQAIHREGRSA